MARRAGRVPTVIDRHLLRRLVPVMLAAFAVALGALLAERLLRLLDLAASHGAGLGPVLSLVASLVPHYVGLALPAAFCVGVLGVLSRMSRDNELDAMEAAGWSLRRIGAPFVVAAAILAVASLILSGLVQPYARHAYRATLHALAAAGWDGRVEQGVFVDLGEGMTLSARTVDPSGRVLGGVFLVERAGGGERVLTAARALVEPDPAARAVRLALIDGRAMLADGATVDFARLQLERVFAPGAGPFRPRDGAREMTLPELWASARGAGGFAPDPEHAAELHGRLVRAVSMLGVAFLAVPLGAARKRTPAAPRLIAALAALAAYHNALDFAAGLAAAGRVDPAAALWTLGLGFVGAAFALYLATAGTGARSPAWRLFRAAEALADLARRRRPAA